MVIEKIKIKKKGQMKIQQMAFMLIAVMVFFGLVALLIITVKFSGLKEQAVILAEENAMLLVSKLANSPEFSCGNAFGGSRTVCIDFDKVMALKSEGEKYKDFWKVSKLEIVKIYPKSSEECALETYPDCGKITIIQGSGISTENFAALCRNEFDGENYDKCELAKILVSYEKVQ